MSSASEIIDNSANFPSELNPLPLMGIITGFWAAKTLATAVDLDLFARINRAHGLTREQAARELGIEDRPADLFLAACASLGLLEKRRDTYVNSPMSAAFLVPGKPYYFGGFVRYLDHREYPAWQRLPDALRTNRPLTWDPDTQATLFDAEDPVMLDLFWEAMHSMSVGTGKALATALPALGDHQALLDVGGGSGAISIEVCKAFPSLRAAVFDLPHVAVIAAEKIETAGLTGRITTAPGDFLADERLPAGYDVILLSSILHDWDETSDRATLAKCYTALPPGGALVIVEILLNDERTGPPEAALMGLNMLVETLGGKNYSGAEYRQWLADTGFVRIETIPCIAPGTNGIIVARKP
jgi:3-hydroxy-5-methyl-1-naphthoate 3-O-methyltransferase